MNRGVFREGGRWPREPIGYGRFYDVIDLEPRKTSRSCHFRPRGTGLINLSGQSFAQRREREREGGKDDEAHAQPPAFAKSLLSLSFRGPGCSIPRAAALTLAMIFGRAPPAPSSPPPDGYTRVGVSGSGTYNATRFWQTTRTRHRRNDGAMPPTGY